MTPQLVEETHHRAACTAPYHPRSCLATLIGLGGGRGGGLVTAHIWVLPQARLQGLKTPACITVAAATAYYLAVS